MSDKGIKTKREEDFSEWYLEVVRKGGFVDQRTPVKGVDVITPWGYRVWEIVKDKFDFMIKENDVENAYFPLFIPESLIEKEKEHFEGFEAEGAMVTRVGEKELEENLLVRPTSETIMYTMFKKWIRSHKDLPLKINQWCNVVRWDTKMTLPFIRGREFLWQEGHTAHAEKEEAENQVKESKEMYQKIYDMMAMDALVLIRPEHDTFPGADYSTVFDTVVQDGKVVQGPDAHMLGQNFSKPFDVKFMDENQEKKYVWQTSWGMTTRQIGILLMHHGDDQGAILPPEISPVQVIIVPILFEDTKEKVLKKSKEVKEKLEKENIRVELDDSDESAGYKFNQWEMKGVPLRLEIGPKDIKKEKMVAVKRNDGNKEDLSLGDVESVKKVLEEIQTEMYDKSKKMLRDSIKDAKNMDDLKDIVGQGIGRTNWCGKDKCADWIKDKTGGGEIRGTLYGKDEEPFGKCVYCGEEASKVVYVAKAY